MKNPEGILEAVVFDCDGVILESAGLKSEAFFKIGGLFGPDIQRRFYEYHLRRAGVSRYEKFAWLYREELGREITSEESRRLGETFVRHCGEALRAAPLVPGFEETLARLKGRVPLFVASGTPQEELLDILAARGLSHNFQAVLGTPPAKAELLARAIAGFTPGRVLMVGDGETDLAAARANGTLFFGRGALFKDRGLPWAEDLRGLGPWLRKEFRNM